ncbi:twin-arginine translocase TatA/TatE family subunit [Thermophilibacter provencensis]|uniref:Sec-independent protein translocase protein TatA n=1 Tax=Thermophilibacter provencensis TaxID=1852386 RepID=A0ABT7V4T8_9ACTN|nr:twin-arginine translocase TatA/TatE family subunit [Thermophilibacter provencensis]MDM8271619.1 twin-arginine translocase TatA/TatE family subunit [Thermophilibacter provencensis]
MFLGMGIPELVIIVVIVLIIFGPKNLPKIGSALGKTVKNVREGMEDGKEEISEGPVESHDDVEVIEDEDDADAPEAASTDAVFCSKCGAKNAADAEFCSKCGNKLN